MPKYTVKLIADRYSMEDSSRLYLSPQAEQERHICLQKIISGQYLPIDCNCPICNGDELEILAQRDRYNFPIKTAICKKCGLIQSSPIFRTCDYEDFYTNHYRKLYISELVGNPEDFFTEERWRGQRITNYILRHVNIPLDSLILEVGCGSGGILSVFSERGFRVIGTDFGVDNLEFGRTKGLEIHTGSIHMLRLQELPSLIIYSHVLEHICDLDQELRKAYEMLTVDGYLYIEVPGVKDVRWNSFQGNFIRMFHFAHIYNFTLSTLSNLLSKYGFDLVSGDETVRTIFRKKAFFSDYENTIKYIKKTEKNRRLYGLLSRTRIKLRGIFNWVRATSINLLKTIKLYDFVKRFLTRNS